MTAAAHHRVVVIGAGYAGILAANRVQASLKPAEARRVSVVMVTATGHFIDRVRLHEVAAGSRESAAIPLDDMLHGRIEVVVATVLAIDGHGRTLTVATDDGVRREPYDTLVYAVGSTASVDVPGVSQFAHPLGAPRSRPGGTTNASSWSAEGRRVWRLPPSSPSSIPRHG
jgi:NADH dehydrogenase